jgi:FkbM family methyltransferase
MPSFRQQMTAALARRYPLLSGCGSFGNSKWVRMAAGQDREEIVWAKLHDGSRLRVPIADYVGRAVYYVGDLDRKVTRLIEMLVRPGDTVLDIGANLGVVTFPLASLVGRTGRVLAFEPNPPIAQLLQESITENRATQITLHTCALGTENGEMEMSIPGHNAGMATLDPSRFHAGSTRVRVPVRRLTDLLQQANLGPISLMKIDVEGFEAEVLEGGRDYLTQHPPAAILFESNAAGQSAVNSPTVKTLQEWGYTIYGLPKRKFRLAAVPLANAGDVNDCLAVRDQAAAKIQAKFG